MYGKNERTCHAAGKIDRGGVGVFHHIGDVAHRDAGDEVYTEPAPQLETTPAFMRTRSGMISGRKRT